MSSHDLSRVANFAVYRPNIGKIEWEGETDVRGLDLDAIVDIEKRGVEVYESDEALRLKPPVGCGLNKPAVVTLYHILPAEGASAQKKAQFEGKLRGICERNESEFVDYEATSGQWTFRVQHFSKYGLDDDSDDDENDDPRHTTNQQGAAMSAAAAI
jgi:nuclear pore complex protein Nup98-Nup96